MSTLELALTAILVGAIGIFSPTRLALSVVMLTSETRPWGRAIAYLIGGTAVFAAAALIGLLGVQAELVRRCLRAIGPYPNLERELDRLYGSDVFELRAEMAAARVRDDRWFFEQFVPEETGYQLPALALGRA